MPIRIRLPGETLKDAQERERREDRLRKRRIRLRTREINQEIFKGDEFVRDNRLKKAYYRYLAAREIAGNFNGDLIFLCDEKLKMVQDLVYQDLYGNLKRTIERMEELLLDEQFDKLKANARRFSNYIKGFEWVRINEVSERLQDILLNFWEKIFPKLESLADNYYDNNQYEQARVLFIRCKEVVKEFKFGPNRTRLIQALMHYELVCESQIKIAKMYDLIDQARDLMNSNQKQKAISKLSEVHDLESKIPIQYRDRQRLRDIHSKMDQIREDYYKY